MAVQAVMVVVLAEETEGRDIMGVLDQPLMEIVVEVLVLTLLAVLVAVGQPHKVKTYQVITVAQVVQVFRTV